MIRQSGWLVASGLLAAADVPRSMLYRTEDDEAAVYGAGSFATSVSCSVASWSESVQPAVPLVLPPPTIVICRIVFAHC